MAKKNESVEKNEAVEKETTEKAAKTAKPKAEKTVKAEKTPKAEAAEKTAKPAKKEKKAPATAAKVPEMLEKYRAHVVPALQNHFQYKNVMQIPKLKKIVVNMGLGEASRNAKLIDIATTELRTITGQQPVVRNAKKSISNFKLREGMPVGLSVTLRGVMMWEFLNRLLNVALPRIRDFRGVNKNAFDGRGNFTLGVTEQIIFPEIEYDKIDAVRGMNITFVTSAPTDNEARELLKELGMPFQK